MKAVYEKHFQSSLRDRKVKNFNYKLAEACASNIWLTNGGDGLLYRKDRRQNNIKWIWMDMAGNGRYLRILHKHFQSPS